LDQEHVGRVLVLFDELLHLGVTCAVADHTGIANERFARRRFTIRDAKASGGPRVLVEEPI
jgi:hypothetical protein